MPQITRQRRSPRLKDYDYTQSGAYFVTICTHERQMIFGAITTTGSMNLSIEGQIAAWNWNLLPERFPMIELDAFVVMPNHVHGILLLRHEQKSSTAQNVESFGRPVAGSLSTIIRSYKSVVTLDIRKIHSIETVIWQSRFHDHIIRNEGELNRIREYVQNNPSRWHEDTFYGDS